MRLSIGIAKGTGLVIQNPPDSPVYQPTRGGHGDLHLYWQPVYQDVIRSVGPLSAFLPSATYEGSGDRVIFSHIEGGRDILSLSRPLGRNEGIPEDVLTRLDSALKSFKAIAHREGTSPDVRRFVEDFTLPSVFRFPDAYRVYQPTPFSRRRYFILWGFEPIGATGLTRADIGQVQMELRSRDVAFFDGVGFLVRLLAILFGLATAAWIIAFILLPEPKARFSVLAQERRLAQVTNQSYTIKTFGLDFGSTAYLWDFEGASPRASELIEPAPIWQSAGTKKVTLKVTHSSILWLCKSDSVVVDVNVATQPPPTVIVRRNSGLATLSPDPITGGNRERTMPKESKDNSESNGIADLRESLPEAVRQPPSVGQNDGGGNAVGPGSSAESGSGAGSGNSGASGPTESPGPGFGLESPRPQNDLPRPRPAPENPPAINPGERRGANTPKQNGSGEGEGGPPKTSPPPPSSNQGPEISKGDNGRRTEPRSPEVRYPIGEATITWFGSRTFDADGKSLWATLEVECPSGYRVSRVSFNGSSKSYAGRFEQLVKIGPNIVEIDLIPISPGGRPQKLGGTLLFNRPFEVIEQPGGASGGDMSEIDEPEPAPRLDPKKVPSLSPDESA